MALLKNSCAGWKVLVGIMESKEKKPTGRRPLIVNNHKKQSLNTWVVPLVVILAIIFFLPRVIDMLD